MNGEVPKITVTRHYRCELCGEEFEKTIRFGFNPYMEVEGPEEEITEEMHSKLNLSNPWASAVFHNCYGRKQFAGVDKLIYVTWQDVLVIETNGNVGIGV